MLEERDKDIFIFDFLRFELSFYQFTKDSLNTRDLIPAFDEAKILGFYYGEQFKLFEEKKVLNALFRRVFERSNKILKSQGLFLHQLGSCFCLLFVNTKVRERKPLGFQESLIFF